MNIRKGDKVQIITGDTRDHGKVGKILSVNRKTDRIFVEGVNLVKRHTKPTSENQQGGIIEQEAAIHVANVMPWCESASRPSPIIRKRLEDGTRVRVYKINGETVEDAN